MSHDLMVEKIHVDNFLEYAQAIAQSKFYISNQSQGYQLCQGQFHPSILEVWQHAPNVIPIGEKMYDFMAQVGLEYYFHELYGDLDKWFEEQREKGRLVKQPNELSGESVGN
jgi:hypothetical protein